MHDLVVLFLHVQDGDAAQRAVVSRLSAAFGIEGGAVQSHRVPVFHGLAGADRGGKGTQEGIFIVKRVRFHGKHSFHSSKPRACFQVSTRRQAVSMTSGLRVPSSTAWSTWGIWVR